MQPITNAPAFSAEPAIQQAPRTTQPPARRAETEADLSRPPVTKGELTEAASQVEKFVQSMSSDLQFSVDDTSGSFVIKVVDRSTKQVIRQIPSEEMLEIAKALDRLQGLLVRQQA